MIPLYRFETFKPSGDPQRDILFLAQMIAKAMEDIYKNLPDGATGTLTSADTPAKTVTVKHGIITEIT